MKDIIVEVQSIPSAERHHTLFKMFDELSAGQSLIIVNNHDPKPLLAQFEDSKPAQFTSDYLENGPSSWKVKLTKKMKEGCCGCC